MGPSECIMVKIGNGDKDRISDFISTLFKLIGTSVTVDGENFRIYGTTNMEDLQYL